MTANRKSLEAMTGLIKAECGVNTHAERYHIVGCEDVPGFEAVVRGERVNTEEVEPGIVQKAVEALREFPESRAFLLECTELHPYADAIRDVYIDLPEEDLAPGEKGKFCDTADRKWLFDDTER